MYTRLCHDIGLNCSLYTAGSIQHEDRAMSNAQAFLQSAWLGDAVSIKRYLVSFLVIIPKPA